MHFITNELIQKGLKFTSIMKILIKLLNNIPGLSNFHESFLEK